jgi:hypothetical protein
VSLVVLLGTGGGSILVLCVGVWYWYNRSRVYGRVGVRFGWVTSTGGCLAYLKVVAGEWNCLVIRMSYNS